MIIKITFFFITENDQKNSKKVAIKLNSNKLMDKDKAEVNNLL